MIAASFGLPFAAWRAAMTESRSNPISTIRSTTLGAKEGTALEAAATAANKIQKLMIE
jgi:hypothetical protein